MRALIIATAMAVGIASPALACSRIVPVQQGETEQEAWQRARRTLQSDRFRDSTSVFVADIVELKRIGSGHDQGLQVAIQPLLSVKGAMPDGVIRYTVDFKGIPCGDWDLPNISEPGLFFSEAGSSVSGMISISRLEDQRLRDRLFEEVDSAPPAAEVTPSLLDELPTGLSRTWPWWGAGSVALLIAGFLTGRATRPANKKIKAK